MAPPPLTTQVRPPASSPPLSPTPSPRLTTGPTASWAPPRPPPWELGLCGSPSGMAGGPSPRRGAAVLLLLAAVVALSFSAPAAAQSTCNAGFFAPNTSTTFCQACPGGTINPNSGAFFLYNCTVCPSGTWSGGSSLVVFGKGAEIELRFLTFDAPLSRRPPPQPPARRRVPSVEPARTRCGAPDLRVPCAAAPHSGGWGSGVGATPSDAPLPHHRPHPSSRSPPVPGSRRPRFSAASWACRGGRAWVAGAGRATSARRVPVLAPPTRPTPPPPLSHLSPGLAGQRTGCVTQHETYG
jgi:hypothetical protein